MFVIYPETAADWQHAMFMLSYYHVRCKLYSNGEDASTTFMVVSEDEDWSESDAENLRLAEISFQMDWHPRSGLRCVHCDALPEPLREETCGHLTFHKPINSAF